MKPEECVQLMLNKQLEKYDLTIDVVRDIPEWYQQYTMNDAEFIEWKNFCINAMRANLKFSKKKAEKGIRLD